MLASHDQGFTLDDLLEIWKQTDFEESEKPKS
jgi:hypothetical protein